jgi:outer membrane receptor protein involved in Fe transport
MRRRRPPQGESGARRKKRCVVAVTRQRLRAEIRPTIADIIRRSTYAGDQDQFLSWAIPYIRVTGNTNLSPDRIKSRTILDFSLGYESKNPCLPIGVQIDVLNAFDEKGVYNILSTFGGTNVIPPRIIAGRIHWRF